MSMVTRAELMKTRSWTRTAITSLLGPPDAKQGRKYLYDLGRVLKVEESPEGKSIRFYHARKIRAAVDLELAVALTGEAAASLETRFPDWRTALPDAAEAMFSLNRCAKWSGGGATTQAIYELKNMLVELLHRYGFCESAEVHDVKLPDRLCYNCNGNGERFYGGECSRCDGTGVYEPGKTLKYVNFRFLIGDKRYAWHQPRELVKWPVVTTEPTGDWLPESRKVIPLLAHEVKGAVSVVVFVVERSGMSEPGEWRKKAIARVRDREMYRGYQ